MFPSISLISIMVELEICGKSKVFVVNWSSSVSFSSSSAQTVESSLLKEYSILTINSVCG